MQINQQKLQSAMSLDKLRECEFSVPIYQRLFVWDEEQITRLLDDLMKAFRESPESHYDVGIISVWEHINNGKRTWEVVDGQQRLTFFTLLGCECIAKKYDPDGVWQSFIFTDSGTEKLRIHYVARDKDEEWLKSLAQCICKEDGDGHLLKFHYIFESKMSAWREENIDFSGFSRFCCYNVDILVNELPSSYTPYDLNLYFEKMNSTGRQLTPVEMVKGRWFAEDAIRWNNCLDFDFVYSDKVVKDVSSEISNQGIMTLNCLLKENDFKIGDGDAGGESCHDSMEETQLVMRPEVFLLHVLANYKTTGEERSVSFDYRKLLQEFQAEFESSETEQRRRFVDCMVEYRKWIDVNIIYLRKNNGSFDYKFRCFTDDDTTDADDFEGETGNRQPMRQFQGMLYVSSSDAQEWVWDAYQSSGNGMLTLELLMDQDRARHNNGSIPALEDLSYGKIDRYWFWRLDYVIWKIVHDGVDDLAKLLGCKLDRYSDAIKHYTFRSNRSIEHLHPQTATDASEDEKARWGQKLDGNTAVTMEDSFGNLAMISSRFNSLQSNEQINTKLSRIKDQIRERRIESLKMLVMAALADDGRGAYANWTVDVARRHGEAMYNLLKSDYEKESPGQLADEEGSVSEEGTCLEKSLATTAFAANQQCSVAEMVSRIRAWGREINYYGPHVYQRTDVIISEVRLTDGSRMKLDINVDSDRRLGIEFFDNDRQSSLQERYPQLVSLFSQLFGTCEGQDTYWIRSVTDEITSMPMLDEFLETKATPFMEQFRKDIVRSVE